MANRLNSNAVRAISVVEGVLQGGGRYDRRQSKNLGSTTICAWGDIPLMKMRSIKNRLTRAKVKCEVGPDSIVILAPANFNFVGRCEKVAEAA